MCCFAVWPQISINSYFVTSSSFMWCWCWWFLQLVCHLVHSKNFMIYWLKYIHKQGNVYCKPKYSSIWSRIHWVTLRESPWLSLPARLRAKHASRGAHSYVQGFRGAPRLNHPQTVAWFQRIPPPARNRPELNRELISLQGVHYPPRLAGRRLPRCTNSPKRQLHTPRYVPWFRSVRVGPRWMPHQPGGLQGHHTHTTEHWVLLTFNR